MKKLIFIFLFCVLSTLSYAQQDCKLCGDWVGITNQTYDHKSPTDDAADWRPGTVTHYLRIEKYGDEFKIRTKRHYKDREDGGIVYDDDDIEILKTTDTSIYYKEIGDCLILK